MVALAWASTEQNEAIRKIVFKTRFNFLSLEGFHPIGTQRENYLLTAARYRALYLSLKGVSRPLWSENHSLPSDLIDGEGCASLGQTQRWLTHVDDILQDFVHSM